MISIPTTLVSGRGILHDEARTLGFKITSFFGFGENGVTKPIGVFQNHDCRGAR